MRKFYFLSTLVLTILFGSISHAQDFSNKGKEFWLCFPSHVPSGANLAQMSLFITSDRNSSGVVSYNGQTANFTVVANTVTEVPIVRTAAYIADAESNAPVNKGINVKVNPGQPAIVVYSHIYAGFRTAATLVLPVNVLGKKYRTTSYWQASTGGSRSQFQIIAVEANTQVQVQLRKNGAISGTPFTVSLPNVGDVYQIQDALDLTGSYLESVAAAGGTCKRIAVFSGSSALSLSRQGCNGGSFDPLNQQCYPVATWGKNFGIVPIVNNQNGFQARVMASEDGTTVQYGGTTVVLNAGEFYPAPSNNVPAQTGAFFITADKPISVSQYLMSQVCANTPQIGDPDMILLNPIEQNIKNVTLFTSTKQAILQQHMNVFIKTIAAPSFRINGVAPPGAFVPMPTDPNYSYLQHTFVVGQNSYTLTADSGFNVICYGLGDAESYGYSGGTNVKDLYQQIGVSTQYGIEPTPSVCKGSPFRFKVSLPYCADSIKWDLSLLPGPPVQPPTMTYANCAAADSTTIVNGIPIYWYSLPSLYTFNVSGTFPVTITTYTPNIDGCGTEQDIDFDLNVYDPPVADFTFAGSGCVAEAVQFTDITETPRPSYIWNWNFGDPASGANNTSGLQNPTHIFSAPGTYTVTFSTITTPGCISNQITKQVTVAPIPSATITGAATVCVNDPQPVITFTGTDGTPEYTFSYTIDNGSGPGPVQTLASTGGIATINVPTTVPGTYRYSLVEVKNTGSTLCVRPYTNTFVDVVVNANTGLALTAGSSTQSVCVNTAIADIQYTISGGGNNATATGLPAGVTSTYNAGVFTITGTPSVPGTYNYSVTATGLCLPNTLNGTITVNPDAAIVLNSANNTQTLCINTPVSAILYSITGGGTGGTVTGLPAGLNGSFAGGVFTISGSPTVAGTFNYTVNTTGTCVQTSATGTITVTPNATLALTSPAATTTQTVCINHAITNITYQWGASGTDATVTGLPAGVTATPGAGGVVTISGTPTVFGTFPYTIQTVGPCVNPTLNGTITVTAESVISLSTAPATENQELCINSAITTIKYAVSGSATNITVTGLPAGVTGTFAAGELTIIGTPTVSGTFNYTVTPVGPCVETGDGGTIIVNPLPTPDFSVSTPSCETSVLNFTDLSTPNVGAVNGWTWNFGDASPPSTLQNPTHTYAAAGAYTVTLSVTNDKGCVSNPTLSRTVTVNPKPVTDAILPEVCLDDTFAQFYDNSTVASGSIVSWLWNFGDPGSGAANTSTLEDPQHSYSAVGNYTITLTTTTNNGCSSTNTFPFVVNGDIPVADFTALNPATMCANDSISIQDASTVNFGSVTKIEIYWDNVGAPGTFETDDTPTPGKIYKHKYPNFQSPLTRNFTIRYRAYSGATCVNDRLRTITVNAAPLVQFNNMPNVCLDAAPFQITQASEIGGVPGTGVFSGPGVNGTGTFNPASVGPGTYLIKYTFTSSAGGCVDTLSKPITVLDSASAQFTYSTLNCEGSPVSFNSTSSTIPAASGTITGWTWNFGDPASGAANTSTLQNPTHLFSGWGTYTVTLSVTTSNGCRSTLRSIPVFVNPIPRPNFTMPASSCLPAATVAFNSAPSTIADGTSASFTYLWNFDDPASGPLNTSTNSSPSHIYNSVGPFNVNLQITSGVGCVHDTTILLNTIHPQPTGSFTVDKTEVCVGAGTFTFTDNSDPEDGTTVQWSWNMDDGNVRNTPVVVNYNFSTPRTYNVSLFTVNSHGCRSTSFTLPVTVHPYPVVDAGPDRIMLEGGQIVLEPTVTGNDLTYLWTPALTGYFAGSNAVKNPSVNGIDDITLTLTVTARGGCKEDDQVFIKVLKFPSIPNIFSPNGDGVHDRWEIPYLNTYPGSTVDIYNRYGQLIFHSDGYNVPWDGTVKGQPVPVGTYYYIVNPKNGRKLMSGYVDVIR